MSTRTILEVDATREAFARASVASIRALCQRPDVVELLDRGEPVEILPGVRALARRGDSEGLTVRVGNGACRHEYSEPGDPHAGE